jgi:hypothetical protein
MTLKNILNISFAFTILLLIFLAGNGYGISLKFGWNPPEKGEATGYKLYYGTASGSYDYVIDAGNTRIKSVRLQKGYQYYFVVTAYNEFGESAPSDELPVNTCNYKLSPSKKTIKEIGGIASVKVKTQSGCEWTATSGADWLTVTDGNRGDGSGVIMCSVGPNDTYETRTAISTFAGKTFILKQRAKKTP